MDTYSLLNATGLTEPGVFQTLSLLDSAGVEKKVNYCLKTIIRIFIFSKVCFKLTY